tara:strand:- start:622 stop:765 length:144 start_codon:yes stop_codon:yes gene_type:complete
MKILSLVAICLLLNGCVHFAVFSIIKETATWSYYDKKFKKLEEKQTP